MCSMVAMKQSFDIYFFFFLRAGRCFHFVQKLPSAVSPSLCLSVKSLCDRMRLSQSWPAPNEFRSSSLCNGAADPKLWALIHLSSVWWKNQLSAIQLCCSLTEARKRWTAQWIFNFIVLFFFLFLYLFSSFDGMARIHKPNNYILLNNAIVNTRNKKKNTDIIFFTSSKLNEHTSIFSNNRYFYWAQGCLSV